MQSEFATFAGRSGMAQAVDLFAAGPSRSPGGTAGPGSLWTEYVGRNTCWPQRPCARALGQGALLDDLGPAGETTWLLAPMSDTVSRPFRRCCPGSGDPPGGQVAKPLRESAMRAPVVSCSMMRVLLQQSQQDAFTLLGRPAR